MCLLRQLILFFFNRFYLFIYLFLAVLGLCCCAQAFLWLQRVGRYSSWGARASHCGGLSLWSTGSRRTGFSSCGLQALGRRLNSCGSEAVLLRGMWDLPGPGLEAVSPALAGGFSTTAPPGKPQTINSECQTRAHSQALGGVPLPATKITHHQETILDIYL